MERSKDRPGSQGKSGLITEGFLEEAGSTLSLHSCGQLAGTPTPDGLRVKLVLPPDHNCSPTQHRRSLRKGDAGISQAQTVLVAGSHRKACVYTAPVQQSRTAPRSHLHRVHLLHQQGTTHFTCISVACDTASGF